MIDDQKPLYGPEDGELSVLQTVTDFYLAGAGGGEQQTEIRQEVQQDPGPAPAPPPDPVEAPDNLRSNSFARIIDVLGEGEIEGLVDRSGRVLNTQAEFGKGIFIDETPLLNSDGKPNFQGFKVGMTWGTADQQVLTGFGPASDVIYSGTQVRFGLPISIGIVNSNAERIEVAVRIPSLLSQDRKSGDINGSSVTYRVDCSLNGGSFAALQVVTVKGKTRNAYLKTTSHRLPRSGTPDLDAWTIRVVRISADARDLTVANDTFFDFLTVFTKNEFRYPYSAIVAAEVNARGFSGIPARAYRVKGIRVRVPNNYFPETRLYNRDPMTGDPVLDGDEPVDQVWNGGMYVAWSDNPAWCFLDLMTSTRYGLGDYMGVTDAAPYGTVDRWSLYSVARYCDELIDNGFGIDEPRFSCNLVIASREEAWKVMQDMASVFRGILYWSQGTIVAVQDRPKTVAVHFTNANVVDGLFAYAGTAKKARHTVAAVRWNDPGDFYKPKYEYVEDPVAIARYGYRKVEFSAFGCTSRGQAHRLGKWTLLTENFETDTCSFGTGMEGSYLRPGDLISVLDNDRAGVQQGGRIVGIAGNRLSVTLDRLVTLPAGVNTVTFTRPQGFIPPTEVTSSDDIASLRTSQVYQATITTAAGDTTTLAFGVALPEGVPTGCVFVIKTATVNPALYRVLNIEELGAGKYGVTGLEYNEAKFSATETDLTLEEPDISDLPERPGIVLPPQALTLTRAPAVTEAGIVLKILASWETPPDASINSFLVEQRLDTGDWVQVVETAGNSAEFRYSIAGTYDVRVTSINNVGARSDAIIQTIVIPNTNPIELVRIVGLQLVDGANVDQFQTQDAKFSWRLVSPSSQVEPGQEAQAGEGFTDPYFENFEVTVWTLGNVQVWREEVKDPLFTFTYTKNQEVGPFNQFRVEVRALDKYRNASGAAKLVVTNPPPAPPSATSAATSWRTCAIDWLNPDDVDLAGIEIYVGASNVFADAGILATVAARPGTRGTYIRTGMELGEHVWFWLKAIDTFGSRSAQAPTGGLEALTAAIDATELADFAVEATKLFVSVIVLKGDLWQDNDPGAGQISWNAHTLVFRGVAYAIDAGNTPNTPPIHQYVWWRGPIIDPGDGSTITPGETAYRTSITHPKDTPGTMLENDFIIATNAEAAGVHDLAWRGIANAVIGSAFIRSAAIQDAHIDNVSADKITAGEIVGHEIVLIDAMGSPAILRSNDYVAGVSGWAIFGDGTAEFNDVRVRGALDLGLGYENSDYPGRFFLGAPTLARYNATLDFSAAVPAGKTYLATVATAADARDAIDGVRRDSSFVYSTAGAAQQAYNVVGGFSGGNANTNQRVNRDNVFFSGINNVSTRVTTSGGGLTPYLYNLGNEENGLLYRRLGRAGVNAFQIRAWGNVEKWFSIYFLVFDPPAANDNIYPAFGDATHPWNLLTTVTGDGSATRRELLVDKIFKITVPDNKCIVFGISPYDNTHTAGDVVMTGFGLAVTALNNGQIDF